MRPATSTTRVPTTSAPWPRVRPEKQNPPTSPFPPACPTARTTCTSPRVASPPPPDTPSPTDSRLRGWPARPDRRAPRGAHPGRHEIHPTPIPYHQTPRDGQWPKPIHIKRPPTV